MRIREKLKHFTICPQEYKIYINYEYLEYNCGFEDYRKNQKHLKVLEENTKADLELSRFLQDNPGFDVIEVNGD